jgi:hypothetical protein
MANDLEVTVANGDSGDSGDSGDAGEALAGDGLDAAERAMLVALADGLSGAAIAVLLRIPEERLEIQMATVLAKLHRQHAAWSRPRSSPSR